MNEICKGEFYLIVRRKMWRELAARVSKQQPSLEAGELAIKVAIELPAAMFQRPALKATIAIPEGQMPRAEIDAAVLDNVREVLEQQTGFDVRVQLVEPEASA